MMDLSTTIVAKSNQLNAEDLLGGPITINITKVSLNNSPDQPFAVHYEGDNGKPWMPCKTMRRVLVSLWGKDGTQFVGRCVTVFCDPSVKWAGHEVGGIRISHMSHIDTAKTIALTVTRGNRKPYTVQPLATNDTKPSTTTKPLNDLPKEPAELIRVWDAMSKEDKAAALKTLSNGQAKILNEEGERRKAATSTEPAPDLEKLLDQLEVDNLLDGFLAANGTSFKQVESTRGEVRNTWAFKARDYLKQHGN